MKVGGVVKKLLHDFIIVKYSRHEMYCFDLFKYAVHWHLLLLLSCTSSFYILHVNS